MTMALKSGSGRRVLRIQGRQWTCRLVGGGDDGGNMM